jgi:hypothetical protein
VTIPSRKVNQDALEAVAKGGGSEGDGRCDCSLCARAVHFALFLLEFDRPPSGTYHA